MTALITKQRYNWMGYNGTETEEVDTALMRAMDVPLNNYNYLHRQRVVIDLKERLLRIKRELGLAPPEDRSAEDEAHQRREEERRRREAEEAEEAKAAALAEAERQRLELEEARRQQEAMERENGTRNGMYEMDIDGDDSDGSDGRDEYSAVLEARVWTQKEMDGAIEGFAKGTRSLLARTGNGYISYLDGSMHPTTDKLNEYNISKLVDVTRAMAGTYCDIPAAEEHSLAEVCMARDERDVARKKLDALRVLEDRTYSARIRSSEKDDNGQPKQKLMPEEGDMSALVADLESAKRLSESVRKEYNKKASASGHAIAAALCMCAVSASPEAEAAISALESETQRQQVAK